jgi:hypothetical protein
MDDAGLEALQDAIRHLYGCESTWVESMPVIESFEGKTIWDGVVQIFDLIGHPEAPRAYAWSYPTTGEKRRFIAVLHVPPVDSPVMAVRAAIVSDVRKERS